VSNQHFQKLPSEKGFLRQRNRVIIEMLFATGIRVGELAALNVADIRSNEGTFRIVGKGSRERMAFVVDQAALTAIRGYLDSRSEIDSSNPALFLNARGERLSTQGVANMIRQVSSEKGITRHITPHMFRHTIATLLLRNGTDIRLVQEFLGHSSITTTQRYTHISKDHLVAELRQRHPSVDLRRSAKVIG
jgi:site-specific recombinase XerD